MKLDHSPAIDPRRDGMDTISRERLSVEDLLQDSPSLRGELASIIELLKPRVARLATSGLFGYGETIHKLPLPAYNQERVLGDWFPERAPQADPLPASGEREKPA